jgi:hypothetical protein
MRATWLPEVLRAAGLEVVEEPGWRGRGKEMTGVLGIIGHHTACGPVGNCPSTHILINGRPDLPGPLAQLQLCRSGHFHMIADGKANHAGAGAWHSIATAIGNAGLLGIEAENQGNGSDWWPAVQMDAYVRGVAAILAHVRLPADRFAAHYEWARPAGRKIDPRGPWEGGGDWYSGGSSLTRNADTFRARVAALLQGDDDMTPAQEAKLDKVLKLLDDYFGVDGAGQAKDIRKKIDQTFIHVSAADHRDLLPGRVKAIDKKLNPDAP